MTCTQDHNDQRERGLADITPLGIGSLHLGPKTALLMQSGYRTIGDAAEADPDAIGRIPSVGRQTVDAFRCNRAALNSATCPCGAVDWATYCRTIGVPLLPLSDRPSSGREFLAYLPSFFHELAAELADDVLTLILHERISKPPDRQMTLAQIAAQMEPPVTRERIRQREKKLLGQIVSGLLDDNYDGLGIHFHPAFAQWWRIAADSLAGLDEIEVVGFVDLLARLWEVPQQAIIGQLPAIVSIVTGEPQLSGGFRAFAKLDPGLFNETVDEVLGISVLRLRMGKLSPRLAAAGVTSVGDAIDRLREGRFDGIEAAAGKVAIDHILLLTSCVGTFGAVDWAAYRRALGIGCLPAVAPQSAAEFATNLLETVGVLLQSHTVTVRAADIFRLRTGQDASTRMTLQQVANEIGTYTPGVKREETYLLAWLFDVLVARDFWMLTVWLDATWLSYWSQASVIFDEEDEYSRFADRLAWRWRLTGRQVRAAAPILWAVFNGYPDGRRSAWQPPVPTPGPAEPVGRILLRGFRRSH